MLDSPVLSPLGVHHVAIIASGRILAAGPLDGLPAGHHLEELFLHVVGGGPVTGTDLSWLDRRGG